MSLFSLIVYLAGFNTDNKHCFLTCMWTSVSNFTTNGGTTINDNYKKLLNKKKMLKFTQLCNF